MQVPPNRYKLLNLHLSMQSFQDHFWEIQTINMGIMSENLHGDSRLELSQAAYAFVDGLCQTNCVLRV